MRTRAYTRSSVHLYLTANEPRTANTNTQDSYFQEGVQQKQGIIIVSTVNKLNKPSIPSHREPNLSPIPTRTAQGNRCYKQKPPSCPGGGGEVNSVEPNLPTTESPPSQPASQPHPCLPASQSTNALYYQPTSFFFFSASLPTSFLYPVNQPAILTVG